MEDINWSELNASVLGLLKHLGPAFQWGFRGQEELQGCRQTTIPEPSAKHWGWDRGAFPLPWEHELAALPTAAYPFQVLTSQPAPYSSLAQILWFPSVCVLSRAQLFATRWTVAGQAPLSMEFSRREYLSGVPFSSPEDLPHPGIEPASPMSPALAGRLFTTEPPGKPFSHIHLFSLWIHLKILMHQEWTHPLNKISLEHLPCAGEI